ncbi:Polysulfide reductase chain C [Candidatus Hydrogenisulfobacillus filiaventi]|uniref:Polysulfide reductase chain C n=1 Tax=Candidatus Hydrogenisulfobacillus filiaventi TaxID=2707344 RepID=A0A6F8ZFS8_9FIRM|nr:Polysulfide reductase chain C [Candidatus Hydrogenisulfobacillus filiaventi]
MTEVFQTVWGWPIAIYLYLGGLGGGSAVLAYLTAARMGRSTEIGKRIEQFGMAAGFVLLAVGTVLLVFDLDDPWHLMYILGNPRSWIFWGVILISLFLILSALYLAGVILPSRIQAKWVGAISARLGTWSAGAAVTGLLVALYTGFLVSMAPAIGFWNTPTLPLLFVVSALSTGAALLMLGFSRPGEGALAARAVQFWEQLDIALIGLELLILLAFFNYFRDAAESARTSARFLLKSPGFLVGFVLAGLVVPWFMEILAWRKHNSTNIEGHSSGELVQSQSVSWGIILASALVLLGGLLLRYYVMKAGVFGYPFPRV